jgi:hypothetical protein
MSSLKVIHSLRNVLTKHCPVLLLYKPSPFARSPILSTTLTTMSTAKDISSQSDLNKIKTDADGTFKRMPSVFRSTIENGGKFEPEAG